MVLECCVRFVCVALWSLVLARVGVALLFGPVLGLAVSVCGVCCLCGLDPFVFRFSPGFLLKTVHSLLN